MKYQKLTTQQIEAATCPPGSRGVSLWDGGGLSLRVSPGGTKSWRFNYTRQGKLRSVTLGSYSRGMTLDEARLEAKELHVQMLKNPSFDPATARRERQQAEREQAAEDAIKQTPFRQQMELYIGERIRMHRWVPMPDHLRALWQAGKPLPEGQRHGTTTEHRNRDRLRRHVLPLLGDRPMGEITAADCAAVLNRVTAGNERKKCAELMRGIFSSWLVHVPGAPDPTNPKIQSQLSTQPDHIAGTFPAITNPREFGLMVRDIRRQARAEIHPATYLFLTQVYLFQRPGALSRMRWADVDFVNAVWKSPRFEMKLSQKQKMRSRAQGDVHPVPLPRQVIELLRKLEPFGGEWVFAGRKSGTHINPATANNLIKNSGYGGQHSMHGCRASAKTVLSNYFTLDQNLIERQMDHLVDRGSLGLSYDRADMLKKRSALIQCWADLVDWLQEGKSIETFVPPNNAMQFAL